MAPLRPTNFRLEAELLEALQEIRERDGVPVTEQVRRALRTWIESKGVKIGVKTERGRAATRRRS